MKLCLSLLLIGLLIFAAMGAESPKRPSWQLATYSDGAFDLYSIGIKEPRHLRVSHPVGGFSTAPNGQFLVYASKDGRHGMGHVYCLDTNTGKAKKLTSGPLFFRNLPPGESELYSDPEISPDSRSIAFAVHGVSNDDSDDAVGLSGPLAVMDFDSGRARVLENTTNIDNQGPCFANTPRWALDGKRILFACEVTGGIANAGGKGLLRLGEQLRGPAGNEGNAVPAGWVSEDEILYFWSGESPIVGAGELFVLNLRSNKSVPASARMRLPSPLLENLVSIDLSKRFVVLHRVNQAEILTRAGKPAGGLPRSLEVSARLRVDIR